MMELDRNQAYGIKPFTIPMVTTRLPVIDSFMTKKIGHTHFKIPNPHSNQKKYMVQDFIFEETQTTGAVNSFDKLKQFSLNTTNQYALSFFADMDKSFVVKIPPNGTKGFFSINVGRQLANTQLAQPGFYDSYSAILKIGRLQGNAPVITYNHFAIQNGYNGAVKLDVSGEFSTGFTFGNITIEGFFPSRMVLPSFEDYSLFSHAAPYGIQSNNSVAYAMFGYATDEATDPGPIIYLKKIQ
ncbi:MAG: hypothetical protein IPJ79_03025 [Bacteroidetes bacterium]|nr:hypothetical protein [Bacteroidota bacterium]